MCFCPKITAASIYEGCRLSNIHNYWPITAVGVYFGVHNSPRLFKQSGLMTGSETGQKTAYYFKIMFFNVKNILNILSGAQRTAKITKQRQFMTPLKQNQTADPQFVDFFKALYKAAFTYIMKCICHTYATHML